MQYGEDYLQAPGTGQDSILELVIWGAARPQAPGPYSRFHLEVGLWGHAPPHPRKGFCVKETLAQLRCALKKHI